MRNDKPFEARLSDVARQDADRITPPFSAPLHQQIMHGVNAALPFVLQSGNLQNRTRPVARIAAASLAVAAAAAVVVVFVAPLLNRPHSTDFATQAPIPAPPVQPTPLPPPTLNQVTAVFKARVTEVVQMAMAEQQYQSLDHDLRLATHYLVDQVPLRSAWLSEETPSPEQ